MDIYPLGGRRQTAELRPCAVTVPTGCCLLPGVGTEKPCFSPMFLFSSLSRINREPSYFRLSTLLGLSAGGRSTASAPAPSSAPGSQHLLFPLQAQEEARRNRLMRDMAQLRLQVLLLLPIWLLPNAHWQTLTPPAVPLFPCGPHFAQIATFVASRSPFFTEPWRLAAFTSASFSSLSLCFKPCF